MSKGILGGKALLVMALVLAIPAAANVCGVEKEFKLWAGQTIDVGTVTVSNDEENLYLTYWVAAPWWLTEVHVYVLAEEPLSRLAPGLAPNKSGNISYTDTYTMTIPLAALGFEINCDYTALWIQAHAAIVMYDANGKIVKGETAYGGTVDKPKRGSWYGNIMYVVQCCGGEGETECNEETAWGGNTAGEGNSAWWFYYDNTVGGAQTIWAGQHYNVGSVEVVDNTLYITLTGGWELQDVSEPVKIQGYNTNDLPTSRPAAGQFTTYKGIDLTVAVPDYDNYAIHLDVQKCQ